MRIYISNSSHHDYESELYEPIRQSDLLKRHDLFLSSEPKNAEINLKDMLGELDLMIAEVSYSSTGVGMDLGRAEGAGIPIVCFYKSDVTPSKWLRFIADEIHAYKTTDELIKMIEQTVARREL